MEIRIPELNGEKLIILNCETTGLKWWEDDRPIGWAYCLPASNRCGYLPATSIEVRQWLRDLRSVHVENINTKFDLHMARADGIDLIEGTGNTFGDVAFQAALLDDARPRFNLDGLAKDFLGWDVELDGLGKLPPGLTDEGGFKDLPPEKVAPYAIRNVLQVRDLLAHFQPRIEQEGLARVLELEREVLPAVVEMEKNGTFIDLELLDDWRRQSSQDFEDAMMRIFKATGVRLSSPDSPKDIQRLFEALNLPIESFTETGRPSFTAAVLKTIDHPVIADLLLAGQLADLESKYLGKYQDAARADGWLRFNLHQLRYGADENQLRGAVSGRFSGAGDKFGGYNPQQVVAVEKQLERGFCPKYLVRRLFIPGPGTGARWGSADAMQIEYRMFAHYANDPDILAAYAADPLTDYHHVVQEMLAPLAPHLNRKRTKNTNFAMIYAAGLLKFALMTDAVTEQQFKEVAAHFAGRQYRIQDQVDYCPKLQPALELMNAYHSRFPRVRPLIQQAADTAKQRGHVKTIAGRRARLVNRYHSALNRVIQGGAADVNKRVLVEVYKHRRELELTLRLTVHDEMDADVHNPDKLERWREILNTQYFDLRVPILWDLKTGANWAEAK